MADIQQKLSMSLEDLIASQKAEKTSNRPANNRRGPRRDDRKRERSSSAMEVETRKTISKPRVRSPQREGRRIIKVSNIDPAVTWKDLKEAFSSCGHVERCDIDGSIAIIIFKDQEGAKKAISAYDGGNLNGRRIKADFA